MDFWTSDQVRLAYQDVGPKTAPAVILVPGFGGYQEIWTLQVAYLQQMHYRVVTYDHRNSGRSQRTQQGLTVARLAQDLAELSRHCQLKRPLIVGHSLGASVAYALLSQNLVAVRAVMGVDQSPRMLNTPQWPYGFKAVTAANLMVSLAQPKAGHETLHGLQPAVTAALNLVKQQAPFDEQANQVLLRDHFQQNWVPMLLATAVPVTLVVATQSPYYRSGYAAQLQRANAQIQAVSIEDCGHDIMAEVPAAFNQTLRHFVLKYRR
ncbi:alpha/beta hydrolase [Lactobacillus sp. CBA3605]|uniref:alpha/beta fold hydrolase n=1 Tax=Lactobacillus sp. CBA3605 TaxID=2099788 RepID=UPI000CFC8B6B|nr:alpha/beta hydrolase [Lactobacillus sp. CBA3605]AVK62099.1 alpha/beta hydrolase [Lactobacillus sp. CBA3605]